MRVLVTGASGLLGGELTRHLAKSFAIVAAHHRSDAPAAIPRVTMDLTSSASIRAAVEEVQPDAVLHAAAYAFVDLCESQPERARQVNVVATETLARVCAESGRRLVAISTDLVYPGDRAWSDETVPAAPLATYGLTKLEGEEAVLAAGPLGVVARVPLIIGRGYGPRGTATEAIAWALGAGRALTLFTDQYRTPADALSIAHALAVLLAGRHTGRFHLGGPERVSRYELGLRVARVHGLDASRIKAALQNTVPAPAPRPPDVSLDSGRARRELGYAPRALDEMIADGRPQPD